MARVTPGAATRHRRNRTLKDAKGFWGSRSKLFRVAKQFVIKGGVYAYRVDYQGHSVMYATDTEHYSIVDPKLEWKVSLVKDSVDPTSPDFNAKAARAKTMSRLDGGAKPFAWGPGVAGKNYAQMCRILAPLAGRILCVPVNSERTSDPVELAELCRAANPKAQVTTWPHVAEAYAHARKSVSEAIVITGSLFLVGEALGRLGFQTGAPAVSEKELVLQ